MSHYSDEREQTSRLNDILQDRRLNDATPAEWDKSAWPSKSPKESIGYDELVTRINAPSSPDYKFREDELIEEFRKYINSTYGGHYGQGGLQSSEVIVDRGHGMGFFLGNVDKYNGRYGKKGTPTDHRKDIVKIIHYGFLALYEHDRINGHTTN